MIIKIEIKIDIKEAIKKPLIEAINFNLQIIEDFSQGFYEDVILTLADNCGLANSYESCENCPVHKIKKNGEHLCESLATFADQQDSINGIKTGIEIIKTMVNELSNYITIGDNYDVLVRYRENR